MDDRKCQQIWLQLCCSVSKLRLIICKMLASDSRALHFNALSGSLGAFTCEYRHNRYTASLKTTRLLGLHFTRRMHWCIFNHFCVIRPQSYRIRRNNANYTAITPFIRSFKITDFGTNRKPMRVICDFRLVINVIYLLSCAVSKLWPIIGRIFAIDIGVPHFNAPAGGDHPRISR